MGQLLAELLQSLKSYSCYRDDECAIVRALVDVFIQLQYSFYTSHYRQIQPLDKQVSEKFQY